MAGMFDYLSTAANAVTSAKPERQEVARGTSPEQDAPRAVPGLTPAQVKAAVQSLKNKGMTKITTVDIAEEAALLSGAEAAPPKAAPDAEMPKERGPYTGAQGGNPSPEMLERMKAKQRMNNQRILDEYKANQLKRSGAR